MAEGHIYGFAPVTIINSCHEPGRDGGLRRSSPLARAPPFSGANAVSTLRPRPGLHHSWEKLGVRTQVFLPRFHAQFYNSLIINAPRNEAWPHPDSHYIRADFKTSYDVLGDTSLVLSVKYSPAKGVPYLKGLSIFL